MKKQKNVLIRQCTCIDSLHSDTCFGTLKCHYQEVNHDPAEIDVQCCRNVNDRLKYIVKNHKMYINVTKWAPVEIIHLITHNYSGHNR
jgi:hypothetical protein